uniref:G_PROTEIN_RECEP_F1_2 domain-containing protein n=1 Tax=Gongylonema pulchrum TaxID=637853 RepID=A0A183DI88_9BILA
LITQFTIVVFARFNQMANYALLSISVLKTTTDIWSESSSLLFCEACIRKKREDIGRAEA